MNVNSVRYDNPSTQPNPWLSALAGVVQGGAGQLQMNQANEAKAQQDQIDMMKAILPGAMQTQQLGIGAAPAGSGYQSFPQVKGMPNFYLKPKPQDASDVKNFWEARKTQQEVEDPNAWVDAASKQAFSAAALQAAYDPKTNLEDALQKIEQARTYFKKKGGTSSAAASPLDGAPDPKGYAEGALLKSGGKAIAKKVNGQWQMISQ